MDKNGSLRRIPKVDSLLQVRELSDLPRPLAVRLVRETLEALRQDLLSGRVQEVPDIDTLATQIRTAAAAARPSLRPVINATGIPLHTNLGRACLSEQAAAAAMAAATRYSTLEYDLSTGSRGSRHDHVEGLLCRLTGAEAAMAVNNNAAAVLLMLTAVAQGGEVVVSRGELVEIGGSFRIPEIMEQCGCRLREVGTTNKTHPQDYTAAIGPDTRALLKVHTSNYRILGFSASVSLPELAALGHAHGLPVLADLGSGTLYDLETLGIHGEPTVSASVNAGADLISFSGDKLLGGPQAGILLGSAHWIGRLKRHPLARAVRLDKMTLAALEATLESYLDPQSALSQIPTLRMLALSPQELRSRALVLCGLLERSGACCQVLPAAGRVGGGSCPTQQLPTFAAAVTPRHCSPDMLDQRLRQGEPPIVGRIAQDRFLLDPRTLWEEDFPVIAARIAEADA